MEEKKNKISLSVFISVLAVLVIIIMAGFIYMQKINSNREIEGLKGDAEELKATVIELQGKLDGISDIASLNKNDDEKNSEISIDSKSEKELTYDYELTIEQIEEQLKSTNYDDSVTKMDEFRNKYQNKKIKVSGYVTYADDNNPDEVVWSDEYEGRTGSVALGDKDNYKTKSQVLGYTGDMNEINKISKIKEGQKITIIGTAAIGGYLDLKDIVILENN